MDGTQSFPPSLFSAGSFQDSQTPMGKGRIDFRDFSPLNLLPVTLQPSPLAENSGENSLPVFLQAPVPHTEQFCTSLAEIRSEAASNIR